MERHVSCVMLTQQSRYQFFQRSVADFLRQTHPDRELLVLSSDTPAEMLPFQEFLRDKPQTRFVQLDATAGRQRELGDMRNVALMLAKGEFICSWDDDDRHHPERIAVHLEAMDEGVVATSLGHHLYHFVDENELWATHWRHLPPGIILYRKTPARYEEISRHEDSRYCKLLAQHGVIIGADPRPELYVRTIHGGNTSTKKHHQQLAGMHGLTTPEIAKFLPNLRAAVETFDLPTNLVVRGQNGRTFGRLDSMLSA